jgi:uncharacterized membrane protein YoaK (UPF0700 family)
MARGRTRLSLFYLAGYLVPAGIALIVLGNTPLDLLGSDHDYGGAITRVLGVVLLALGVLVIQMIRHRLEVLYATTLVVRLAILTVLVVAYANDRDPVWLVLFAVVAIGVLFTGISYLADRRDRTVASK